MKTTELARELGYTPSTVRRWIERDGVKIPGMRKTSGGHYSFLVCPQLHHFIQIQRKGSMFATLGKRGPKPKEDRRFIDAPIGPLAPVYWLIDGPREFRKRLRGQPLDTWETDRILATARQIKPLAGLYARLLDRLTPSIRARLTQKPSPARSTAPQAKSQTKSSPARR